MGGETFMGIGRLLRTLISDAKSLVESEVYKRVLIRCLLEPYNREALADFLVLDNVCRDIRILIGEEGTTPLWEARKRAFEEVQLTVEIYSLSLKIYRTSATYRNRERLWNVLLNALSKRTPDDVYEQIEVGLK